MSFYYNAVLRKFFNRPTTTAVFQVVKDNGCKCTSTRATGVICEIHKKAAGGAYVTL